jgi:hypothetical protein
MSIPYPDPLQAKESVVGPYPEPDPQHCSCSVDLSLAYHFFNFFKGFGGKLPLFFIFIFTLSDHT